MKLKFAYGRTEFNVFVFEREGKRITINVHPDLRIEAIIPPGKSEKEVRTRISHKASWIVKQLQFFDQFHPLQPPREYVNGETHYYLGRQYRLRIRKGSQHKVRLVGKFFEVEVRNIGEIDTVKRVMRQWYKNHARELFNRKVEEHYPFFELRGAMFPKILMRTMRKRWGSCTGDGTITLNTELVKAPLVCIDYVILHEMCHLIYPRHNKKFYGLMATAMPDWERWKGRLEHTIVW